MGSLGLNGWSSWVISPFTVVMMLSSHSPAWWATTTPLRKKVSGASAFSHSSCFLLRHSSLRSCVFGHSAILCLWLSGFPHPRGHFPPHSAPWFLACFPVHKVVVLCEEGTEPADSDRAIVRTFIAAPVADG